jgi:hemerythrin
MPDDFEERQAYVTHLRAEHKRLRKCLDLIDHQWTLQNERPSTADDMSQVLDGLQALRTELAHHFQEEESGGCIEEAVSLQANLSCEANQLEREHPELLGQLDLLIRRMSKHPEPGESTAEIKQQYRRFSEQLHDHEATENRILERSFGIEPE